MDMIVVSVLLSTTKCRTRRGKSSGDASYEVGDNQLTNSKTYLVGILAIHTELPSHVTVGSAVS